ncbi:MAG: cellulase family glycosylhydrolase [Clostridia bacterium]|nr:cellulase family glycosylhydrolase [Clostridia bacterium]
MSFILGCNYWASNAGADMWRQFDADVIEKDLRILSEHGVRCVRIFPNWRDFQPVIANVTHAGIVNEYLAAVPTADNAYYLDDVMLDRFEQVLALCEKYHIQAIVGLITGWMSGGMFCPQVLYGKNLITDPMAQYLQQLFIKGFVKRFRDHAAVYAWDLGNECNCMGAVSNRFEAAAWTGTIANAIRAEDPNRMVVSGMHGLGITGKWTIRDQAMFTDMLTTHPYPFWCDHTRVDEMRSVRTTMHATAQNKWYAEIGGKPCLAEEIGTMGPMVCSDDAAADFLRVNLFSLWANEGAGVLWWCAHDQTALQQFPYSDQMAERELGMLDVNFRAKPVLLEMKRFADFLESSKLTLSAPMSEAVCVLTRGQDHWGIAYMTYILCRQAGINCRFAYGDEELPPSDLYLLPSLDSLQVMGKKRYDALLKKVANGATAYLSLGDTILSEFESFAGLRVQDSYVGDDSGVAAFGGFAVPYTRRAIFYMQPTTANVLATDANGAPFITVNQYGKGRVYVVAAPLEKGLLNRHNAFADDTCEVYRTLFGKHGDHGVQVSNRELAVTYHPQEDGMAVVIVNHSAQAQAFTCSTNGYVLERVCYGQEDRVNAYDACVLYFRKHSL